jgi:hypothetical protein
LDSAGHLKKINYNINIGENERDKVYIIQIYYIASSKGGFIYDSYLFDKAKKFRGELLDSGFSTDNRSIRDVSYMFNNEENGKSFKSSIKKKFSTGIEVFECFSLEDYYKSRSAIK